jgi:hypothetical protein
MKNKKPRRILIRLERQNGKKVYSIVSEDPEGNCFALPISKRVAELLISNGMNHGS